MHRNTNLVTTDEINKVTAALLRQQMAGSQILFVHKASAVRIITDVVT